MNDYKIFGSFVRLPAPCHSYFDDDTWKNTILINLSLSYCTPNIRKNSNL